MRQIHLISFLIIFVIGTADAYAVDLNILVPSGTDGVELLSPGTPQVLSHMRRELKANLDSLARKHDIIRLKTEADSAGALYVSRKKEYETRVNKIKEYYISKLVIRITNARAVIAPDASVMGEVSFCYTARNSSDRVIASVTYRPRIGSIFVPTPSPLVLEFLDPGTLKFGLAPGKEVSVNIDQPERLSFFIGELSAKDIDYIRRNISREFHLDVVDIRFADKVGYKDQTKIMDVSQAFAGRLRPLMERLRQLHAMAREKDAMYKEALLEYNNEKTELLKEFVTNATSLKHSALRYKCRAQGSGRFTVEGVAPGRYVLYANRPNGMAIFYTVDVKAKAQTVKVQSIRKDPFMP